MNTENNVHLLLVDDEESILQTMSIIFEMEGYTLSLAHNGREAMEQLRKVKENGQRIDVVVTDLNMPEVTGLDLVRTMKKEHIDIPVLAFTGQGSKNVVVDLMREGVKDYIEKPVNMDDLLSHVNAMVVAEKKKRVAVAQQEAEIRGQFYSIRKTYEERLLASNEFEILGKLACSVIHDFNNVLAGIFGFTDMLLETLKEDPHPRCESYARSIMKAAETAKRIVDQFQGFKKGEGENFTALNLHEVIAESLKLVHVPLGDHIKIKTEFDAPSPSISGDRALLHNAFVNLMFNARDAMPEGGTLTISTREVVADEDAADSVHCLLVDVKDTGCGMAEEVRRKVFEPFFTTKGRQGNGIGLSSVLSVVERHGGVITVDSEMGKGTVFSLLFPLGKEQP